MPNDTGINARYISIQYVILCILARVVGNTEAQLPCNNERGFIVKQDRALVGHVIETLTINGIIECLTKCIDHSKCLSVNYASPNEDGVMSQCELNVEKGSEPCLIMLTGTTYFEFFKEKDKSYSPCYNNGILVEEICKSFCNCTIPYSGKYCEDFRPMKCKHIQGHGMKQDGEYDLHLMWPEDKRTAKIYCADMSTETPLEYLTLTAGKANNFARYYNKQTHVEEETSFNKVRLNLTNRHVLINDYRFATTNVVGVYHEYASAGDCKSYGCTSPASGIFKVDLSGTSFRLPETIQYQFSAYPGCRAKLFSPSMDANRLQWSATCGGRCGECAPEYLYLEFNG